MRELARLLGMMVAAHPAILPAPLHYRKLERAKSTALSQGRPYDQMLQLDAKMYRELSWWITTIESDASRIRMGSNLQRKRYRRPLDSSEKNPSHKLPRIESSLPSPQVLCM